MKKISLLLVFVMLITSLTGLVAADPCTVQINAQPINIIPDDTTKTTATVAITDITLKLAPPYERKILVHTDNSNVKARIFGNGIDITTSAANTDVYQTYTYDGSTPTFTLEVWGTQAGTVTITDYSTVDASGNTPAEFDVGVSTRDVEIPEFPAIALPVAAILGLVFIFGRKKEGL